MQLKQEEYKIFLLNFEHKALSSTSLIDPIIRTHRHASYTHVHTVVLFIAKYFLSNIHMDALGEYHDTHGQKALD